MTHDPEQRDRQRLLLAFFLAGVAAYALYFPHSKSAFLNDWSYFNSLSLVVRSSVLGYRTFPLHNPWMCGGLDLFANPQNRILSPLALFDIVFPPQWANLTAMIALSVAGAIGGYRLLRWMATGRMAAAVGGILWINGSWFGLHLAEGHIPYASMQLLPWVMYLALRIGSRRHLVTLALLLAAFLLDGGMYTFIYSLLLVLTMLLLGMIPRAQFRALWSGPKWEVGAIVATFVLLAIPKVLPVVTSMLKREPWLDFYVMSWPLVKQALFDPRQTVNVPLPQSVWRFHEYGCYLSWLGLALIALHAARSRAFWRRGWMFPAAAGFWFWVGSGWRPTVNPWLLFQKIPLINNAHVQSRVFIIMFLFFIIMLARALDSLRQHRQLAGLLAGLLVAEALFARNYPMSETPPDYEPSPVELIHGTTIDHTLDFGWTPADYYRADTGYAQCYEPGFRPMNIKSSSRTGYRGEAYLVDPAAGEVRLTRYTPGHITLWYDLNRPSEIELNTNGLLGWHAHGDAKVAGQGNQLLRVKPDHLSGTIRLHYWPRFMTYLLASYLAGLALAVWLWRRSAASLFRKRP